MLTAAVGLLCGAATTASAQKIDDKGKCHDAHGKYAKMDVCKGGHGMAMPVADHHYMFDKKNKCRDEKGRMAKMGMCKH
jgi:hypothetical protein